MGRGDWALSADGSTLATLEADGTVVRWDVWAAREVRRWQVLPPKYWETVHSFHLACSPDGRLVATQTNLENVTRLWNAETGREIQRLEWGRIDREGYWDGQHRTMMWGRHYLNFSPDGRTLAIVVHTDSEYHAPKAEEHACPYDYLQLWDVPSGKLLRMFRHKYEDFDRPLLLAPDGRGLAGHWTRNAVWEVASGAERLRLREGEILACSRDGRLLAGTGRMGELCLWDATTGAEVAHVDGHRDSITALAFSADGNTLVSTSQDTTALVWDVDRLVRLPKLAPLRLDARRTAALWDQLADADAARAFEAVVTLGRAPEQTVPLLETHLKPLLEIDERRIEMLVADLRSNEFAVRQKATADLERLGEQARPALEKALAGKPPLDTAKRLRQLLDQLVIDRPPSPRVLQVVRAVEVLERLATPEARRLLAALAKGPAGARLTREAQAALRQAAAAR
jgi:hypothetical protein